MTILPDGTLAVDNLGTLKDEGYDLSWFCESKCQGRRLSLALDTAIELWGRERSHIAQTNWDPVTCSVCGGRKFSINVAAPAYSAEKRR